MATRNKKLDSVESIGTDNSQSIPEFQNAGIGIENSDSIGAVGNGNNNIGDSANLPDFAGLATFDPAERVANADTGSNTEKRGRGRPRRDGSSGPGASSGTGNNTTPRKSQKTPDSVESLTSAILILNMGMAALLKEPIFNIEKSEAELIGRAASNLMDQFEVKPNPKLLATAALGSALATVYGPRIKYMMDNKKS